MDLFDNYETFAKWASYLFGLSDECDEDATCFDIHPHRIKGYFAKYLADAGLKIVPKNSVPDLKTISQEIGHLREDIADVEELLRQQQVRKKLKTSGLSENQIRVASGVRFAKPKRVIFPKQKD